MFYRLLTEGNNVPISCKIFRIERYSTVNLYTKGWFNVKTNKTMLSLCWFGNQLKLQTVFVECDTFHS